MIIGVYGIERSGKTTLLKKLVEHNSERFVHISRTKLMNQIALNIYGKELKEELSSEEEDFLYYKSESVIRAAEENFEAVMMDCHAGYYTYDKRFLDFKRDEFHLLPDEYIMLDTLPETVLQRMNLPGDKNRKYEYTLHDIQVYRELELERLQYFADKKNKKIYFINGNANSLQQLINIMEKFSNE